MGGLVSSIFGGGGGSSGGGGTTTANTNNYYGVGTAGIYQPTGQSNADYQLQGINNTLSDPANNLGLTYLPAVRNNVNSYVNNPYASGAQQAATNAGYGANSLGTADITNAYGDIAQIPGLQQESAQIGQTAFDPQNALYNRTLQQVQDQVNAQNSMSGLGTSPVGASIADQALGNFNIDWQNNQLARQAQGASAQEGLQSTAAGLGTTANSLGSSGVNLQNQAGQLPYSQYGTNITNNQNAYSGLQNYDLSSYQMPQQAAQDLQSYLGLGQSANSLANSAANQGYANSSSLGSSLGSLLGLTGGGSGGSSGGIFGSNGIFGGLGSLFGGGSGGLDAGDSQFLADAGAGASGAATGGGFFSGLGSLLGF